MSLKDVGLAVLVQLIWGVGFTLMKPAMDGAFPPLLFITLAYTLVALFLTPLAPRSTTPFWWMALIALLGGSAQSCLLAIGLTVLPASTSTLLLQLTVPFAVLMSWAARIDRPSARNGIGCLVALAGVAVVIGAPGKEYSWLGIIAIAIGSFTWSFAQIVVRLRSKDSGAAFYGAMARHAAPQALLASLWFEQDHLGVLARATIGNWVALVAIAIPGFAGGYVLWYHLLIRNRIDHLLPFTLLMPPIGVATGLMLGETLHQSLLIGGAVILAGLAIIVWPHRARR
jgi:O-acetylserine/cysteine efflux transporter